MILEARGPRPGSCLFCSDGLCVLVTAVPSRLEMATSKHERGASGARKALARLCEYLSRLLNVALLDAVDAVVEIEECSTRHGVPRDQS